MVESNTNSTLFPQFSMYPQKARQGNLIANLSKSIAFCNLSAVGHFTRSIQNVDSKCQWFARQIPKDFYQFQQFEALLSCYPLWGHIMATLAVLDCTLAVTAQLQMDWTTFFYHRLNQIILENPFMWAIFQYTKNNNILQKWTTYN